MANTQKKKDSDPANFFGSEYGEVVEYSTLVIDGNSIHTAEGEQLLDPDAVRGIKDELLDKGAAE